jgi:site-specific recombinase XerD
MLNQGWLTEDHNIGEEEPLFPITQQWVRAIINRYGAVIGKNIHPYTFRHSFAINSVRHGVDIRRYSRCWGIQTSIRRQST